MDPFIECLSSLWAANFLRAILFPHIFGGQNLAANYARHNFNSFNRMMCNYYKYTCLLCICVSDPSAFASDFSSGFLLGELLFKFGLQNDFDQFSQNKYVTQQHDE